MAHLNQLVRSAGHAILVYGAFVLTIYLFETRAGADPGRYRSRNFAIDVLYTLFYKGGFYSVLMLAAVTNALGPRRLPAAEPAARSALADRAGGVLVGGDLSPVVAPAATPFRSCGPFTAFTIRRNR
jgi:hypothetical protein